MIHGVLFQGTITFSKFCIINSAQGKKVKVKTSRLRNRKEYLIFVLSFVRAMRRFWLPHLSGKQYRTILLNDRARPRPIHRQTINGKFVGDHNKSCEGSRMTYASEGRTYVSRCQRWRILIIMR